MNGKGAEQADFDSLSKYFNYEFGQKARNPQRKRLITVDKTKEVCRDHNLRGIKSEVTITIHKRTIRICELCRHCYLDNHCSENKCCSSAREISLETPF